MPTTLFYLGRFLKKLADDKFSSITKDSIYHIEHMYIQHFPTVVDWPWPEIGCLMEVSTMFYICRYCVFTWDGRNDINYCFVVMNLFLYCCESMLTLCMKCTTQSIGCLNRSCKWLFWWCCYYFCIQLWKHADTVWEVQPSDWCH